MSMSFTLKFIFITRKRTHHLLLILFLLSPELFLHFFLLLLQENSFIFWQFCVEDGLEDEDFVIKRLQLIEKPSMLLLHFCSIYGILNIFRKPIILSSLPVGVVWNFALFRRGAQRIVVEKTIDAIWITVFCRLLGAIKIRKEFLNIVIIITFHALLWANLIILPLHKNAEKRIVIMKFYVSFENTHFDLLL